MNSFSKKYFTIVLFLSVSLIAASQKLSTEIKLNQSGFYPGSHKLAIITGKTVSNDFYITSTNLRDTVFKGSLGAEKQSAYSTTSTRLVDFSQLSKLGSFVVVIPALGNSYVFEIGNDVLKPIAVASLKGYYYQRSSIPLQEKYAGKWHRSAGHPDDIVYIHAAAADAKRPEGTMISSPGGWYDAGDYNKYIVNSGITMGTLFSAYEDFPDYFNTIQTNIPESADDVPDILNEAIYNLRWMLTMQDANDGGVYHKCTNASFDGMVMPGITKAPRFVVQKGTAATLDLAAVTAQAGRILKRYKKQFPGLADSCMNSAKKAWAWALIHPAVEYDQSLNNEKFKPAIVTGAYGNHSFDDEWLWAAGELFSTTFEPQYFDVVKKQWNDSMSLPTWSNVGMLGCYSLIRLQKSLPAYTSETIAKMKAIIVMMADKYLGNVSLNAFATVMGQSAKDYNWGGNSNAANQGILLVRAYLLSGNKKYLDEALGNLDYILGRNATGYCFVTGFGSKSPMFPHHRPSVADGITEPVPGLLVGGPNKGMQDKCHYEFIETETAYADNDCAYASNEIAINWNAPLVYLTNALEALKQIAGYTKK